MSKPTMKEMLEAISGHRETVRRALKSAGEFPHAFPLPILQKEFEIWDAIYSLILAVKEWQSHAMAILCSEFPEYDGTDVSDFMREIRDFDFGKEKK